MSTNDFINDDSYDKPAKKIKLTNDVVDNQIPFYQFNKAPRCVFQYNNSKFKVDHPKDANYDKLSEEGYAKAETIINDGDVVIGMVNSIPTAHYKDTSVIYKSLVPGAIDKVLTGLNSDGYPITKIRSERIPVIGDMFCSTASQMGTIGIKPHRADMQFIEKDFVPPK